MKTYKMLILSLFVALLTVPAIAVTAVPYAEAACSQQGFYSSGGKCANSFKKEKNIVRRLDQYESRHDALQAYIIRLLEILERLRELKGDSNNNADEFNITTRSATEIDSDSAVLRGRVAYGMSDEAEVWFVYGTSAGDLDKETSHKTLEEVDDEFTFEVRLTNLAEDTKYYYRAIGEDDDNDEDRGSIFSFTTDDEGTLNSPDVTTDSATNVNTDSARLRGSVDMRDFENGKVFFVYGENETQVSDVEVDFNTYSDVIENGDDLQKVLIDSNLDTDAAYGQTVSGLTDDTKHYFAMCVEYEDEDSDDDVICGNVRNFTTD